MGSLCELLALLEERLVHHDNNREDVQSHLQEVCSGMDSDADSLEEKIIEEISKDIEEKEEKIFGLIEKLNKGEGDLDPLVEQALGELSRE